MTLTLLRHAKAAPSSASLADVDRPLAASGERDLAVMVSMVATTVPDLVLCSAALRTRQTLDHIWPALTAARPAREPVVRIEARLYLAEMDALIHRLQEIGEDFVHVLMVGHNPGLSDLALALAAPGSRASMSGGLPTAGLARLSSGGSWSGLRLGCAELLQWSSPRRRR